MKLGKIYTTLEPTWQRYLLLRKPLTYPVPTEFVIPTPQIVVPDMARAYHTDLYVMNGAPVPYGEVRKQPGFVGTYRELSISLVEVWEDDGDDGHAYWATIGWRFVPSFCLGFVDRKGLPEPMQRQLWEWEFERSI